MNKNLPTTKQNTTLASQYDYELYIGLGHNGRISSLAITPDGKYIVSVSKDKTIKLWNINSSKELAQYVFFSDDEWLISTPEGYYNYSKGAYKYFHFQDKSQGIPIVIDKSHSIYKERRKNSLNIKIGKIIDKYPNGIPQTDIGEIKNYEHKIEDIDEDDIPF